MAQEPDLRLCGGNEGIVEGDIVEGSFCLSCLKTGMIFASPDFG